MDIGYEGVMSAPLPQENPPITQVLELPPAAWSTAAPIARTSHQPPAQITMTKPSVGLGNPASLTK